MNTPASISYGDIIKQAAVYLNKTAESVASGRSEQGLPAGDIQDPTKKSPEKPSDIRFTDAKATNMNLPEGENKDTKKQPESASASGALEGNRGNAPTADKKEAPIETNVMDVNKRDATNKVAEISKLATDILTQIASVTGEKKAEMPPALAAAMHEKKETPAQEKKEEGKAEGKKDESKKEEKKEEKKEKEAGAAPELHEMTRDFYAKIALAVMKTDEGKELVEKILKKEAGAEAARAVLSLNAQVQEEVQLQEKAAAEYQAGVALCDQTVAQLNAGAAPAPDVAGAVAKIAGAAEDPSVIFHQQVMAKLGSDAERIQYAAGAETMARMIAKKGEAPEMGGGEEAAAAGAGGQEVTLEDVAAALQLLVEQGSIPPEVAQQVLQELSGGGAAAGAGPQGEEAAMAAAGGAGAAPGGEEKMSAAKLVASKIAAALARK